MSKNKGGRPPVVLTDEQIKQVEQLAGVLNQQQLADFFGITDRTFLEIKDRQPEVSSAYKRGRATAINGVGQGLLQKALGGDTASAIFYLKTQAGWRETKEEPEKPIRHTFEFVNASSRTTD